MDAMSQYVAAAAIEAKLASAQERRPGRQIEKARRAERRHNLRIALAGWWQRFNDKGPEIGSWRLLEAAPRPVVSPSVELAHVLDEAAHHIAERGTGAERPLLAAMAEVVAQSAPGAAAALVDPDGSEASRLRAFGHVHGHLLDVLGEREHACLLDLLGDGDRVESPGRVA